VCSSDLLLALAVAYEAAGDPRAAAARDRVAAECEAKGYIVAARRARGELGSVA